VCLQRSSVAVVCKAGRIQEEHIRALLEGVAGAYSECIE